MSGLASSRRPAATAMKPFPKGLKITLLYRMRTIDAARYDVVKCVHVVSLRSALPPSPRRTGLGVGPCNMGHCNPRYAELPQVWAPRQCDAQGLTRREYEHTVCRFNSVSFLRLLLECDCLRNLSKSSRM
eukprot:6465856-Amphidinium_carterae.2